MDGAFPINPVLTGITLGYRNTRYIADLVLPRIDPVAASTFKWNKWAIAEGFTLPDTRVGRKSVPNEVEFTATEETGATKDYGLDDVLPNDEVAQAVQRGLDPIGQATEGLTDLILLDRERRVAGKVFAAATYAAPNKTQLAGTDKWTAAADPDTDTSDPVADISAALEVPVMRPNTAVFGRPAWVALSRHPKILRSINPLGITDGIARRQAIADLFELDEIIIGEARLNGAKKGQAPSLARVWGGHVSFFYKDTLASRADGNRATFGMTVPFGDRVSGDIPEPKTGLRGSVRVRVGESVAEIITAAELGYFIEDAA